MASLPFLKFSSVSIRGPESACEDAIYQKATIRQLGKSTNHIGSGEYTGDFRAKIAGPYTTGWAHITAGNMSSLEKFLAIMIQQPAFWIALSLFIPVIFVILQWAFSEAVILVRNFSARSGKRPIKQAKRE
jgi:hypothetical protein